MRTMLTSLLLISIFYSEAQSFENITSIFPGSYNQYKPTSEYLVKELKDGTLRISRKFVNGEKELKVKLSASSEENLDANLAAIGQLIISLEEMANQGVMTIERDEGKLHSGLFTFISRQQNVAGGLFLVRDRYMLEIEIIGAKSADEARAIFAQVDLTKLE